MERLFIMLCLLGRFKPASAAEVGRSDANVVRRPTEKNGPKELEDLTLEANAL